MQGKTVTDVTNSFDIGRDEETGAFLVRTRPEAEEHTVCKRRVSLTGNKYGNEEATGPVAMTVKMGAAKFTQSTKTVNAFSSPTAQAKRRKIRLHTQSDFSETVDKA